MKFKREIWEKWEIEKPCPSCNAGTLKKIGGVFKNETAESKEFNENSANYSSDFIFSTHLKCSNCSEYVAVSGYINEENYPSNKEKGIQKVINPVFFCPPPKIINLPISCPKSIKKILNESFSLYWIDIGSCANKIRISIEVLLNELKIPIKVQTRAGVKELKLHNRLEKYKQINSDIANLLMAIKWIGNTGSHYSEIKRENLLDAFELLEVALDKLYNDREQKLIEMTEQINRTRKPI